MNARSKPVLGPGAPAVSSSSAGERSGSPAAVMNSADEILAGYEGIRAGHFTREDAAADYAALITSWWAGGYEATSRTLTSH